VGGAGSRGEPCAFASVIHIVSHMWTWIRRVLAGFGKFFELEGRLQDVEDDLERFRAQMIEQELEWISQVDKLTALHRRASKRIQDGTQALAEAMPSMTDLRASRAARKAALRAGRLVGGSAQSVLEP